MPSVNRTRILAESTSRCTVAIEASWLESGGIGRMAREILARRPADVEIVKIRAGRSNAGFLTPLDLATQLRRVKADALWSPGFMPPLFRSPGKRVCITIHDLAHLHHYSRLHRGYYDVVIKRLLGNVDRIFTVSRYTRRELLAWAGLEPERVVCIYNGVSDVFRDPPGSEIAEPQEPGSQPYVLYVGNRRGYKNIDRLISGFARSGLRSKGYALWLTGDPDDAGRASAEREGIGEHLRYLGTIDDSTLARIYRGARALAFVSLYEGFGLPLVEAMASACPVLTSDTTALAEIAGDAALTVDPLSIDAIAAGLERVCLDEPLRTRLRAAGLKRSAQFTWDSAAAQYWQVLAGDADRGTPCAAPGLLQSGT